MHFMCVYYVLRDVFVIEQLLLLLCVEACVVGDLVVMMYMVCVYYVLRDIFVIEQLLLLQCVEACVVGDLVTMLMVWVIGVISPTKKVLN